MASLDLSHISRQTSDQADHQYVEWFQQTLDMHESAPKEQSAGGGFWRRLNSQGDAGIPQALLATILMLESRVLSSANCVERITHYAVDAQSDNQVVLIWESVYPEISRAVLDTALLCLHNFLDLASLQDQPIDVSIKKLFELAGKRRLDSSTAYLRASATRKGIPWHISNGQIAFGQGARQQRPPFSIVKTKTEPDDREGLTDQTQPLDQVLLREAEAIIEKMFPQPDAAFIPSLVFAGDRATSAAATQAEAVMHSAGLCVGTALKNAVKVGLEDKTTPKQEITHAPETLLQDPAIEAIVAAMSMRRIVNQGLGFPRCDGVALLLDPEQDQDITTQGIDVLIRACRGPFTIDVNNRLAPLLADRIGANRVILVSHSSDDQRLVAHLEKGGLSATRQWSADGPLVQIKCKDFTLSEAPLERRAMTRERLLEASMHAFALVQGVAGKKVS